MDSKKNSIKKVLDLLKQLLLLLIMQLILVNPSIGQYEDWSLPSKVIQNEAEYGFKNSIISISPSNHISIKIDSASIFNTLDNINSLNSNFGYYQIDSGAYSNFYIKDFKNDTSFLLKKGNFSHIQCFDNFLVLFGTGKYRITLFNFKNSKMVNYSFYARPIGNDDSSIYIVTNDFRHNKKKYRYGTIVSLNENGINIVKPVYKKKYRFDNKTIFYSSNYKVFRFYRKVNNSVYINYCNNFLDSFNINKGFSIPEIFLEKDTLTVWEFETFRKYYKMGMIGKWEQSEWVDKLPVMKESILRSYYNIGDLLLLKYEIYSGNLIGIKKIGGKFFTLNNFPLKAESTVYTIVLAFNIRENTFLGYPDIEF